MMMVDDDDMITSKAKYLLDIVRQKNELHKQIKSFEAILKSTEP